MHSCHNYWDKSPSRTWVVNKNYTRGFKTQGWRNIYRVLYFVMLVKFAGLCVASSLDIFPAAPTSVDKIAFTVSYEDPGYAFNGSSITIHDHSISITYRQTGYAAFPPFVYYFTQSIGPLAPGEYTVQVFWEHRFMLDVNFDPPVPASTVMSFTVSDATPQAIEVVEYFHKDLSHYFMTAYQQEIVQLDSTPSLGWERTGERFRVLPSSTDGMYVCRFYGSIEPGPNSHFYTLDPQECESLKSLQRLTPPDQLRWNLEGLAFSAKTPTNGSCPYIDYSLPVQRFYNDRAIQADSNHRFTVSAKAADFIRARGWIEEGVVMCVIP